jgi:hypothetical protein
MPRPGYELTHSADVFSVFVVSAILCHSCSAVCGVRQPWTLSLSSYSTIFQNCHIREQEVLKHVEGEVMYRMLSEG